MISDGFEASPLMMEVETQVVAVLLEAAAGGGCFSQQWLAILLMS